MSFLNFSDGEPDFDYFMKAVCPKSTPYKCPPHAKCYNNEQYCTSKGDLESCFSRHNFADDTAILKWCQKLDSSSNLSDPTCQCACFSKFRERLCVSDQGEYLTPCVLSRDEPVAHHLLCQPLRYGIPCQAGCEVCD